MQAIEVSSSCLLGPTGLLINCLLASFPEVSSAPRGEGKGGRSYTWDIVLTANKHALVSFSISHLLTFKRNRDSKASSLSIFEQTVKRSTTTAGQLPGRSVPSECPLFSAFLRDLNGLCWNLLSSRSRSSSRQYVRISKSALEDLASVYAGSTRIGKESSHFALHLSQSDN